MKASALRIPFVWKDRRPIFLERCLYLPGHYEAHETWERVPWEDPLVFGNSNPVVIEYCSGNGEWICGKAKEFPEKNWVAIEKRFDRARKIWARLHRENLPNVFVVCGEAFIFTKHYAPIRSVQEVFVNFPDPWPKLRHAKHRLIRKEFLKEVEKILVSKAQVMFTTDDREYLTRMIQEVLPHFAWKSKVGEPYFTTDDPLFGPSYFLKLWKSRGRTIYHLPFEVIS